MLCDCIGLVCFVWDLNFVVGLLLVLVCCFVVVVVVLCGCFAARCLLVD